MDVKAAAINDWNDCNHCLNMTFGISSACILISISINGLGFFVGIFFSFSPSIPTLYLSLKKDVLRLS